ncbi:MAG: YvcK family protein [Desulfobacteraceae bacterium]
MTIGKMTLSKVITIGGGSGQYALLCGLKRIEDIAITAIVSMVDSGGSTGRLRDELGILPPGDILKCVLALSPHQESVRPLLQKRFMNDRRLKGHNAGNMLLTMLSRYTGSFPSGVAALAEILDVKGTILPVTTDRATLVAELTDGTRIYGEGAIDMPREHQREKIKDVYLVPHHADRISVHPPVVDAIKGADFIIIGPGDLFTSIIPNLIVPGVKEAIQRSSAKLVYIVNIMTKFGETHTFKGSDFVQHLEVFTQKPIDIIVGNNRRPNSDLCDLYAGEKSEYVETDPHDDYWNHRQLYTADLLDSSDHIIRHDSKKLANLLRNLILDK